MAAYLVKTEPSDYSFSDLVRDGHTAWSGVAGAPALGHLRAMRRGDMVAVYHTGREKAVVGIAEVACDPYPDPALGDPRRVVVDLVPKRPFRRHVTLEDFRTDPVLEACDLVHLPRLSVMPLTDAQLRRVLAASLSPLGAAP